MMLPTRLGIVLSGGSEHRVEPSTTSALDQLQAFGDQIAEATCTHLRTLTEGGYTQATAEELGALYHAHLLAMLWPVKKADDE